MKIKILICDDDINFVDDLICRIKNIKVSNCVFEIYQKTTPEDIENADFTGMDIVLLDIELGKYNGIEIARRIRRQNVQTLLLFVTNYIEYSPEGYEVQAFRYLLKDKIDEKLEINLKDACNEIMHQQKKFVFSNQGELYDIDIRQIYYMESRNRIIIPHLKESNVQNLSFYSTLDKVERDLLNCGFLRIHNSFLVNMAYISSLDSKGAVLQNGEILPVSRKKYAQIRAAYTNWKIYHLR